MTFSPARLSLLFGVIFVVLCLSVCLFAVCSSLFVCVPVCCSVSLSVCLLAVCSSLCLSACVCGFIFLLLAALISPLSINQCFFFCVVIS